LDSRQRVEGFLHRSPIDRVPVQLQNMAMTVAALGRDFPDVYCDGKLVAAGHIHEWEKYRHDGVIVDIGTQAAAESLGCEADYPPGDIPRATRPAMGSWADLDRLAIPDPWRTFPLTVVLEAVGILKGTIGKHTTIIATVDQGPFTLASQLFGMDRFLLEIGLREHKAELHQLLSFCADFTLAYGIALRTAGADIVRMGDSSSGPDMVSPKAYTQYAFPYHKRLAEEFARRGIVFEFHICGNATPIIEAMVATGAAYVEIDEKTDLGAARQAVRERGGVGGPISPSLLRFGTEAEVETACRQVLEAWLPQGGLFFGAGCTLPWDTPEANIRTLMACAEQYGSYQ
jgi:uroporphyrinogen decarboxylase